MMMLLWNTLIDSIRIPYKLKHNFDKLYFIIDSAKCHTTPKLLNHLRNNNIKKIIVPPRFTNLIQPADLIWFRCLLVMVKMVYFK